MQGDPCTGMGPNFESKAGEDSAEVSYTGNRILVEDRPRHTGPDTSNLVRVPLSVTVNFEFVTEASSAGMLRTSLWNP